jgi:hypothetical protein
MLSISSSRLSILSAISSLKLNTSYSSAAARPKLIDKYKSSLSLNLFNNEGLLKVEVKSCVIDVNPYPACFAVKLSLCRLKHNAKDNKDSLVVNFFIFRLYVV